jgi:thymidylate synthase
MIFHIHINFFFKHEEYQYLDIIRNILANGQEKIDRTCVGTKSLFGIQSRYSLENSKI